MSIKYKSGTESPFRPIRKEGLVRMFLGKFFQGETYTGGPP